MDSPAPGPLKPRVLALAAQGEGQQQEFIDQLSDAERDALGAPDAWAAKDHVAHIAAWKADAARVIAAAARGETPAPGPDETAFNPQVFAAQQHQPWEAILSAASAADAALRAALEACGEADLSDPARFPWRAGSALWFEAFVSGYDHPAEHYAQFHLDRGDVARAAAALQRAVESARPLIGETRAIGYMLYKLGCFYAQNGQPALALSPLRESFAHVPGLREGSREDPNLASLLGDPAFQALVAGTVGDDANTP